MLYALFLDSPLTAYTFTYGYITYTEFMKQKEKKKMIREFDNNKYARFRLEF